MNHRLASLVSRGFVYLAFVFVSLHAGGVELAAHAAADVGAVEGTPSEDLPDVMAQLAPKPPNLPLRNTLIIGAGATLVTAFGMAKWWEAGFGGGFDTV